LLALEQIGIKLGLDQIRGLLRLLARPDVAVPAVAVAGTNGKGSVAAMLERGLREVGFRTGRYTSPHLIDLEERIVVNGRPIDTATFDRTAERVLDSARALPFPPTFFETTTAMALEIFRAAHVEIAVLETGLGGRLDATNAVWTRGAAITAVDFDHEQYLGHTIEAIAAEKAGIIKPASVVVLAPNDESVARVVAAACRDANAVLIKALDDVALDVRFADGRATITAQTPWRRYGPMRLALRGRHQVDNALTAIRLLEALADREGFVLPVEAVHAAVEDVEWPARLELVRHHDGDILIDGAHNPSGARALASYVADTYGRRLPMVVALMRDKAAATVLRALGTAASTFVCTAPDTARAFSPPDLCAAAAAAVPSVPAVAVPQPADAVRYAATLGSPVVVAGSLYLAGAVRASLSS